MMTVRQYFQEKKFRRDFRNGFHIRVPAEKKSIIFEGSKTAGSHWYDGLYPSSFLIPKPEVQELLDSCQPYRMIKNARGHTDFYFMWADSLVKFKLSLDI